MSEQLKLSSTRPYLLRAMYDWLIDNGLTPHVMVDASADSADLPLEYATDGKVVLNLAPRAVHQLEIGNDWVSFAARFGGRPRQVLFPTGAALAIYARENAEVGMIFGEPEPAPDSPDGAPKPKGESRSHLKVVK